MSDPATQDSLSSHSRPDRQPWGRKPRVLLALVAVMVAAVLAAGVLLTMNRPRNQDWPTGCGVGGHPNWCDRPSAAMTGSPVIGLVHGYCPGLSSGSVESVVPQPLSAMDLADSETLARTSGSAANGREDALLGQPGKLSWVTRWVGGKRDGLMEVRCPTATRNTPSLRLQADQLESTLAASQSTPGRHIDFGQVAKQIVVTPDGRPTDVSFGFLECDTTSLQLTRLQPGDTFSCVVEAYTPLGKAAYRGLLEVTAESPFFKPRDE